MNCGGIRHNLRRRATTADYGLQFLPSVPEHRVVVIHHVVIVPDGLEIVPREGVGVGHPPKGLGKEAPTGILALFCGRDTQRTKYRSAISRLVPLVLLSARGNAPVGVPVPVRDAQWYPRVEILFGRALRRSVHRADQYKIALRI